MIHTIGINLGGTHFIVAQADREGKSYALQNLDGGTTTPSCIYCAPPDFAVGEVARQSSIAEPDRVVWFDKDNFGVDGYRVEAGGRKYSMDFVAALLLRKLVQDSSLQSNQYLTHAVTAVPAYYNQEQRKLMEKCMAKAGLSTLKIIDSHIAAALYHGVCKSDENRKILVFDLGGTTFQAAILHSNGGRLRTLALGGDLTLGGRNWDERIAQGVCCQIKSLHKIDICNDLELMMELKINAEKVKQQLTCKKSAPIFVGIPVKRADGCEQMTSIRIDLSREAFERMTPDLLDRTRLACNDVLQSAGLQWSDLTDVIAVGGSSHMPMVISMLKQSFDGPILRRTPECSIAKGSALYAAMLRLQQDDIQFE